MPKCFLRLNTPTVRERIKHAGFTICACASFEEAVWLCYFPGCTYDIHGIGYDQHLRNAIVQFLVSIITIV